MRECLLSSVALSLTLLSGCVDDGKGLPDCQAGVPAGPSTCRNGPVVSVPIEPKAVGPAPLRRLSNAEYHYALADLFPQAKAALPTLPSDGVVGGFDNAAEGQVASDVRIARYEASANAIAAEVASTLPDCSYANEEQHEACVRSFVAREGRRLFRRPLSTNELDSWTTRFSRWQKSVDFEAAAQLTLSAMLQAPPFLYRPELVSSDVAPGRVSSVEPYAMASRLSFFLWASVPDEELLAAAGGDQLHTTEQVEAQAKRMLSDPRAARVLWDFHRQWLGLDRILEDEHQARTPRVDPDWSVARQRAVYQESRLFVENVLLAGGSLRDLLRSTRAWVNDDVAKLYGVTTPARDGFFAVDLPPSERAGILTRAAFLAGTSHRGATSPPVRANAVRIRMLCKLHVAAPPGTDTTPPTPSAGLKTNRMSFDERTAATACQACHASLNGIGFGLESYNAAGAYTALDQGLPIDASGQLLGTDVDAAFRGGVELSQRLADSYELHRCAASQWLRYALGRAPVDGEQALLDALTTRLMQPGASVLDLLLGVVTSSTFRYQHAEAR